MTQDDINSQEWHDAKNWLGPRWLGIYFSKKDARSWVPKPGPILGRAINLGNPAGAMWATGIVLVLIVLSFLTGVYAGA
ncbi:hypothetical protein [Pseudidiomarina salinarum]|uniref:hypothetical protein n=1 Tax=Pseudidiomarina salinarum TaxID=435908 RepID=UPI00068989DB|nr:hypothetical protein [Pseudidiomarina salinarum]RUO71311.1 hypothetical protein CWI79_07765 [Pseudidiomarina salinarum]